MLLEAITPSLAQELKNAPSIGEINQILSGAEALPYVELEFPERLAFELQLLGLPGNLDGDVAIGDPEDESSFGFDSLISPAEIQERLTQIMELTEEDILQLEGSLVGKYKVEAPEIRQIAMDVTHLRQLLQSCREAGYWILARYIT